MISQSNLPPSAEEEVILRAGLMEEMEAVRILDGNITTAQGIIASNVEALDMLTRSFIKAQAILKICPENSTTIPSPSQTDPESGPILPCVTELSAQVLGGCKALSPNGGAKISHGRSSIRSVNLLKVLTRGVDDALRRHRLIINVNSCSIKLYSLTRDIVQVSVHKTMQRLSVVRRVPDEIWYEILTLVVSKMSHSRPHMYWAPPYIPVLTYSHVCRSWRRVVFSSPNMWRAIHWSIGPDKEPNRNLINLWLEKSPENDRRIYERQSHRCLAAAGSTHMKLQLPVHKNLKYYFLQTKKSLPSKMNGDKDSEITLPYLLIKTHKYNGRSSHLQADLLHRFKKLETLRLGNTCPNRPIPLPCTLAHLEITFDAPHNIYDLSWLLSVNLETLDLSHFSATDTPVLHSIIELPKLRTICITPLEHSILNFLSLPILKTLTISPLASSAESLPAEWLASLIPHCSKVVHLKFGWPSKVLETTIISLDMVQTFFELRLHVPKLRTLQFSNGSISGSILADILGTETRFKLEELTIDACRGVSRMDCERFVGLVDKLVVMRSIHGVIPGS